MPERIAAAWQRADGAGIAAMFTEDADFILGDGTILKGPTAIAAFMNEALATFLAGTRVVADVQRVRFLDDDVAVMHTTGGSVPAGEPETLSELPGIQTFVVTRTDGLWLITAYQVT